MHIGRTLPPAAAPISLQDILAGLSGLRRGRRELARFECELKEFFGVDYCFLVSSGKAALTIILRALKAMYPNRDQVLIPAYTCYSVPSAIVRAGLNVQLCDMHPETLDFDYAQLDRFLHRAKPQPNKLNKHGQPSTRFLALIAAHLFGIASNIEGLRSLIGDNEPVIVEDAAQAMGGKRNNRKLGTLGDVGFFSLGRGKAISTVEGGIILTNRDDIARKISTLLIHIPNYTIFELTKLILEGMSLSLFMRPSLFWFPKSLPFLKIGETIYDPSFKIRRMTPFQAGLARNWKTKLERFQYVRKENSRFWTEFIPNLRPRALAAVHFPPDSDLIRFPIRVKNYSLRKTLLNQSDQQGLGIMPGYPDSINNLPALRKGFIDRQFPMARHYSQQLITLPVHSYATTRDKKKILALIGKLTQ